MFKNFMLAAAVLLATAPAWASTGELYGYGSRASALGNTMMGGVNDSFAVFYNPAAMSSNSGFNLGFGVEYMHPSFYDIKNVVVSNSAVSSQGGDQVGDIDTTGYLDHLGQTLSASLNFGERWKDLSIGILGFLPLARLAYMDTGEVFKPEYFNYRSRTQRPQIYGALSASPFKHLHASAGVAFSVNLASNASLNVSGASSSVSYARFSATVKPGAAPYFALYWDPLPFQAGVTVRMANKYHIAVDTNAEARLLGPANGLPLYTQLSSTLYYDPFEVDLGTAYKFVTGHWLTLEVDWLQYRAFESPSLTVADKGSAIALQKSVSNLPTMQNIWVPKIGYEVPIDYTVLRAGYFYRPSPVADNSGVGNLIDPSQHVFTAGVGFDLQKAHVTQHEIALDLHGQYHWLVKQHITKTAGNEFGTAGESKVGSPGYDIGGKVWGGGVSFTVKL